MLMVFMVVMISIHFVVVAMISIHFLLIPFEFSLLTPKYIILIFGKKNILMTNFNI